MSFDLLRLILTCMTISIAVVFFPLVILGFIRTLGQFVCAKICGVTVLEFVIGFGKELYKIKIGDTFFSLGIIPLGGYVHFEGDHTKLPEMPPEKEKGKATENQRLAIQKDRWFINKSYLQKSLIILAGPIFILFFAFLVRFSAVLYFGIEERSNAVIGATTPGFPAEMAGIKAGDIISTIDGVPLMNWDSLIYSVENSGGKEMNFTVQRAGKILEFKVNPVPIPAIENNSTDINVQKSYRIGVLPKVEKITPGIDQAISESFKSTLSAMAALIPTFLYTNKDPHIFIFANEPRQPPPSEQERAIYRLFLLSVTLTVLFLLPIPFLFDGGHFLFFTVEVIRGSSFNLKYLPLANKFGLAIFPILVVIAIVQWRI